MCSAPTRPPGNGGRNYDVIIVGAGMNGALTTLELASSGLRVLCLERGAIGNGASSRSAACFRIQFDTEASVRAMLFASHYFASFQERVKGNDKCLERNGYLYPFYAWQEALWAKAQEKARLMQSWGLTEAEVLSAEETLRRFPFLTPDNLLGSRFSRTDGFLHTHVVMQDAFSHAREAHCAVLKCQCQVTGFILEGGKIIGVHTTQGDFYAEYVINIANAWTAELLGTLQRTNGKFPAIAPHKRYLYFSELPEGEDLEGFKRWPMSVFADGSYCRPDGDKLMMGWAHASQSDAQFSEERQDVIDPGFQMMGISYGMRLITEIGLYIPTFYSQGLKAVTSGYYDCSPDCQPIIDRDLEFEGLIHAVGFSGHGAMMAPATAHILHHLVDPNFPLELDRDPFRVDRNFSAAEKAVI